MNGAILVAQRDDKRACTATREEVARGRYSFVAILFLLSDIPSSQYCSLSPIFLRRDIVPSLRYSFVAILFLLSDIPSSRYYSFSPILFRPSSMDGWHSVTKVTKRGRRRRETLVQPHHSGTSRATLFPEESNDDAGRRGEMKPPRVAR